MTEAHVLSVRQRELIAVGASVAGNCLSCLRYSFAKAVKAGCTLEEISKALEIAKIVKERPITDIYHLADEFLQRERASRKSPPKEMKYAEV